ncbi:MAG: hypothetical protein IJU19_02275 [Bacteroidales bacterium]|nr:hypothetical protein [Bacteroidales bacterium]
MKKNNIFALEPDDDPIRALTHLLLFHSIAPTYAFADDLNKLYSLELCREPDMALAESLAPWPLFAFHDRHLRLQYYLAERPNDGTDIPQWPAGHKLLIIQGDRAANAARSIADDFASSPAPSDSLNLLDSHHRQLLNQLQSNFTTLTPIPVDPTPPPSLKGRTLRWHRELHATIDSILDYLDLHYPTAD